MNVTPRWSPFPEGGGGTEEMPQIMRNRRAEEICVPIPEIHFIEEDDNEVGSTISMSLFLPDRIKRSAMTLSPTGWRF